MAETSADHVTMVEVGPRDGLQNEKSIIPTETKIELINRLSGCGLPVVEATSFVSPKWVPQLADAADVLAGIDLESPVRHPVLVPNEKGLDRAVEAGAREIAVFSAASEAFSEKNTNCSIAESLERIRPVVERATQLEIPVRGYVSCVLGCPYQGEVEPEAVMLVSLALMELGCYEISLGDTIGVGTPGKARQLVDRVATEVPMENLAVHFHDTYGQALANILACLDAGIRVVDSSVAGLGGCPYAKGATGNVASEDVAYMLTGLGLETGVDLDQLSATGEWITQELGITNNSRAGSALLRRKQ